MSHAKKKNFISFMNIGYIFTKGILKMGKSSGNTLYGFIIRVDVFII